MKKIFNYALAAALVGGLSLSVTSCKSDEDVVVEQFTPSTVTIDNDLIAHGVVTDMEAELIAADGCKILIRRPVRLVTDVALGLQRAHHCRYGVEVRLGVGVELHKVADKHRPALPKEVHHFFFFFGNFFHCFLFRLIGELVNW